MCAHAFCCDKMHVRTFTPRLHEYVRGSLRKIMWWFFTILWLLVLNFIKIQGFNAEIFVKQYWLLRLINFQCILYIFTNIYLRNRQRWITTEWLWDLLETRYQNGPVLVKWKHHFKLIFCILRLSHKHIAFDTLRWTPCNFIWLTTIDEPSLNTGSDMLCDNTKEVEDKKRPKTAW